MKKRTLFLILEVIFTSWGGSFSAGTIATQTPTQLVDGAGTMVAATLQAHTAVSPTDSANTPISPDSVVTTQAGGTSVSSEGVSFVFSHGMAVNATADRMTAVELNTDVPWDIAPTHSRLTLTDYQLQGKFHQPQIFVYPADEYAQTNPNAAEQIARL